MTTWNVSTKPDADLVNQMLDTYYFSLANGEKPLIHSDRGAHYRWPGWIERMNKYGFKRSMSKKGCSPDNSACEGFFGRLKNEMFYSAALFPGYASYYSENFQIFPHSGGDSV